MLNALLIAGLVAAVPVPVLAQEPSVVQSEVGSTQEPEQHDLAWDRSTVEAWCAQVDSCATTDDGYFVAVMGGLNDYPYLFMIYAGDNLVAQGEMDFNHTIQTLSVGSACFVEPFKPKLGELAGNLGLR